MTVFKTTMLKTVIAASLGILVGQYSVAQSTNAVKTPAPQEAHSVDPEKTTQSSEAVSAGETAAAPAPAPLEFSVADGNLNFTTTGNWESATPKSRMLEYEIKVPRAGTDKRDGRLTIMGAGGTIAANIARWEGQFSQPDGTKTTAKVTEEDIQEMKVTMVDISGSYVETMGGPFSGGKKVTNPGFRVLAAIIETPESGNYFVKLIGPKTTIDANEKSFQEAIRGIKLKE